jgi:hypothetical protein
VRQEDWVGAHGLALNKRGLSIATAAKHGWQPCGGPTDDLWISIPIIDQGKRVGTKYRTIAGKKLFTQDKGTPQIFYNVDCLRDQQLAGFPLVITEGEIDAFAIQAGYPRPCVPGGAPDHDAGDGPYWNYLRMPASAEGERPIVLGSITSQHLAGLRPAWRNVSAARAVKS